MSQIGDILREARIHRGLTIKDVSDVTKIRVKYLEALEQSDYDTIPGSTFVKAYIRSYASFLGLDADALVEEYRYSREPRGTELDPYIEATAESPRARSATPRPKPKGTRDRRGYAVIGVVAVIVIGLLAWFGTGRGQPAARLDAESVGGSIVSTTVGSEGTTETSDDVTTNPETSETTETSGESTTSSSAVVATGGDVTMVLTVAEGSCFLVVRDDSEAGDELFAGTLSAGQEETFTSSKRYWLHVGAPEVLIVTVNGVDQALGGPAGFYVVTETQIESTQ